MLNALPYQRRARHSRVQNSVAFLFQPLPQLDHLRSPAHRIGTLDHNQAPMQLGRVNGRQCVTVRL